MLKTFLMISFTGFSIGCASYIGSSIDDPIVYFFACVQAGFAGAGAIKFAEIICDKFQSGRVKHFGIPCCIKCNKDSNTLFEPPFAYLCADCLRKTEPK
jgi:hypothetical protein